jgi:hypothetical protein
MTFTARYRGRCAASCGSAIEPGDEVVYVDDELVHAGCEEAALVPLVLARHPEVCSSCCLVRPCPCDDGLGPVAA